MADADEILMLRASVEKAIAAARSMPDPSMATIWRGVHAIGWGHAFLSGDGGRGAAEAVAVAEECGRAAVALAVPALVGGLAAAVSGSAADPAGWAPDPASNDAPVLWATRVPTADATEALLVPALDVADTVLLVTGDAESDTSLVWRATDLARVARRVDALDSSLPMWLAPLDDDVRALAVRQGGVLGDNVERELLALCGLTALVAASESVGLLDRALTETLDYARSRTAFGRPIGSFQAVKHMLADTKVTLESSRAVVAQAAHQLDIADPAADFTTAVAARHVGRHVLDGLQWCVQVHGGIGVTMECELHNLIRRATTLRFVYTEPFAPARRIVELYAESEQRYG